METEHYDFAEWREAGFPDELARVYIAAACSDPWRTADLRKVGITPEQMMACGMGEAYSDGDTSLADLLSVMLPEGESDLRW